MDRDRRTARFWPLMKATMDAVLMNERVRTDRWTLSRGL